MNPAVIVGAVFVSILLFILCTLCFYVYPCVFCYLFLYSSLFYNWIMQPQPNVAEPKKSVFQMLKKKMQRKVALALCVLSTSSASPPPLYMNTVYQTLHKQKKEIPFYQVRLITGKINWIDEKRRYAARPLNFRRCIQYYYQFAMLSVPCCFPCTCTLWFQAVSFLSWSCC